MNETDRAMLAPYAALYRQIAGKVEALADHEVAALQQAANAATQTNCDWDVYRASRVILVIIAEQKVLRAVRR